jgi:esterase/lipase superfamily enzyme
MLGLNLGPEEFPGKDFVIRGIEGLPNEAFLRAVRDTHSETAVIFVHGYNTSFNDSAYRFAQIIWDTQLFDMAPILFSWPSIAELRYYEYDQASAEGSIEPFLNLLHLLQINAGIKKVHVIAHSMGNQIITSAIANPPESLQPQPFRELIFAAPDVDRDIFLGRLPKMEKAARGLTLYASAADRPLELMGNLAKIPRAGDVGPDGPLVAAGIDSIDVTAMGHDLFALNHSTFAASAVIEDIARLVRTGQRPPNLRTSRIRGVPESAAVPRFWRYAD